MAEQNLRLGLDVDVDAVNDSEEARQTWRTAASRTGAHVAFVHLLISMSMSEGSAGRDRGLAYVGEPTWADVQRRRDDDATSDGCWRSTTARTVDEVAGVLTARFSSS